ncbi:Mitochondrial large subunit ribosomal protein (Img2) family protein [Theileria parva strain Muguga]|uniref:Mitochondrial large subunit ribosomal protein (Img2) family protein n=1 Tax=Theileria parva strain Muguga TaxID=333668 RepID=UPI001C619D6D|nr:Mitochondrial large subunit ribosomal protein (Img2) family protein [Theileria parva strain Muguga]KAF5153171.1 Mitochondrial large subunit ribosomal protein (Img2) family protein [Theileria parva strain Muguga]
MRLTSKALTGTIKKKVKSLIENRISFFPFHINRTISDNLPVFVKYSNNANLAFTHVRKTKGNKYILREELQQIVGKSPIKVDKNTFIIQGNHKHKIKEYLKGIGF